MKRRRFLGFLGAAGITLPLATLRPGVTAASESDERGVDDIDPYFLESGDLPEQEQEHIAEFVGYQERLIAGQDAIMPRGGRPKRAPTYRILKWTGELGDAGGSFQGPLSMRPQLPTLADYKINAQILGFRTASGDWPGRAPRGTLTIEFRARLGGEPMTWLFAQQFDVADGGSTTLSMEYIGQRNGMRDPILTDDVNVDIRIQLMRHRGQAKLLRKILQIFSFVVGLPTGGIAGTAASFAQALPVIRVPRMLREGVAFSQAFFGGMSDESPVWRSGFTTFAVAEGGSRLALSPGYWIVIDESREIDLRGVTLEDLGGRAGLVRDGKLLDANYLVLAVELAETDLSGIGRGLPPQLEGEIVPRELPPADD